jgi:hypothetical protein
VLEGKGVKVGLIVSEGFRQILHIDRSYVPGGLAAFITWNKGPLLAPLESTIEVRFIYLFPYLGPTHTHYYLLSQLGTRTYGCRWECDSALRRERSHQTD